MEGSIREGSHIHVQCRDGQGRAGRRDGLGHTGPGAVSTGRESTPRIPGLEIMSCTDRDQSAKIAHNLKLLATDRLGY